MAFRAALAEVKSLLRLALPVAGALLVTGGLYTIESLFIGRLGEVPLAALSLAGSALNIPSYLVWGLLYPLAAWIGRGHGADDPVVVAQELRHGLLVAAVTGSLTGMAMAACWWLLPWLGQPPEVLAMLKPYWMCVAASLLPYALLCALRSFLEAIDRQDTALLLGVVLLIFAVPSHYVLIFGCFGWPGLGLTGAGLALVLSDWLCVLVAALLVARARVFAPYRIKVALDRALLRRQLVEGFPVCLQNCLIGASYTFVGLSVGWLGAAQLAANQVVMNVFTLLYMVPVALGSAVMVRLAQAQGRGRGEAVRAIGHAAFGLVAVIGGLFALGLLLFARPLAAAFTGDADVIALAVTGFAVLALMQLADGLVGTAQSAVIGLGDTTAPTRIMGLCIWVIAVPAAILVGQSLWPGMGGAWAGFTLGLFFAAAWLMWRFERLAQTAVE